MTEASTYEKLAARFPAEDHKTRTQAGRELTYLPGEKVISRLNEVLKFDWSFRVVTQGTSDVEAWVLGELTASIDGATVTRQQYGNQDLARGQRATTDLLKSAATDALKKCATTIGVGLYLYDEDERREVEQEMREAKRPKPAPTVTPKVDAAARLTGAQPETPLMRWERLVAEAERVKLPSLGNVKAIDPVAVGANQIRRYADQLEARLDEMTKEQPAAAAVS